MKLIKKYFLIFMVLFLITISFLYLHQSGFGNSELPGVLFWSKYTSLNPLANQWIPQIYMGVFSGFTTNGLILSYTYKLLHLIFSYEISGKLSMLIFYFLLIIATFLLSKELNDKDFLIPLLILIDITIFQVIFVFNSFPVSYTFSVLFIFFYLRSLKDKKYLFLLSIIMVLSLLTFLEFATYALFFFYLFMFFHQLSLKKFDRIIIFTMLGMAMFFFLFYFLNKATFSTMNINSQTYKRFFDVYRFRYIHQFFNFKNMFFYNWKGSTLITGAHSIGIIIFFLFFYGIYKREIPYYYFVPALIGINIAFRNKPVLLTLFPFFKGMGLLPFILAFIFSFFILFFILKFFIHSNWRERIVLILFLCLPIFSILSILKIFKYIRAPIHFFEGAGIIYLIISLYFILKRMKKKLLLIFIFLLILEASPTFISSLKSDPNYGDLNKIIKYLNDNSDKKDRFLYIAFPYNLYPEVILSKTNLSTPYGGWYSWLQNIYSFNVNGYLFNNIDPKIAGVRFYIFSRFDPNLPNLLKRNDIKNTFATSHFVVLDLGKQKLYRTERKLLTDECIKVEFGVNKLKIHYSLGEKCNIELKFVRQGRFEKLTFIFNHIYPHDQFIQLELPKGNGTISFFPERKRE